MVEFDPHQLIKIAGRMYADWQDELAQGDNPPTRRDLGPPGDWIRWLEEKVLTEQIRPSELSEDLNVSPGMVERFIHMVETKCLGNLIQTAWHRISLQDRPVPAHALLGYSLSISLHWKDGHRQVFRQNQRDTDSDPKKRILDGELVQMLSGASTELLAAVRGTPLDEIHASAYVEGHPLTLNPCPNCGELVDRGYVQPLLYEQDGTGQPAKAQRPLYPFEHPNKRGGSDEYLRQGGYPKPQKTTDTAVLGVGDGPVYIADEEQKPVPPLPSQTQPPLPGRTADGGGGTARPASGGFLL